MNFISQIIAAFLLFFLLAGNLYANQATNQKTVPTKVKANIIDIKKNLHVINFIGNAVVEKDQDIIFADKMILFYQESKTDTQTTKSKIEKIEAIDNVKLFSQDYVASSKNAYYIPDQDLLTMENEVTVNNGASVATGDKFLYNLKTKKGNFVGQSKEKRAKIIIGNDKPLN